jgi:aminoglycoside phosphotransferase family enzyme
MYQKHLDDEVEIVLAIKRGAISHPELNEPDHHIETGLAHVFFFGERVFKQYKIVNDHDHFIKGVLAPTERRALFVERDFAINQHFSRRIYKAMHTPAFDEHVTLYPYDRTSPHVFVEMEKLDFSKNLHEQLIAGVVSNEQLYQLGQYIAESVTGAPRDVPDGLNWYSLAMKRLEFLEQFIDWMPSEKGEILKQAQCVELLREHLEVHRSAYETISSEQLVISMDNHDENVFLRDDGPVFIDVVPPMESWWYGVPWINVANLVVNVSVLQGAASAAYLEQGYLEYLGLTSFPEPEYTFTKALAYLISAVHFGSTEGKEEIGDKYIEVCPTFREWL